ncbi:MAG: Crp/Fnr family transcriptional regulator [Bacteroidales bacterium]|nr:MAG: Crp/Fnr family transcriptional regulator [Bacteroidales bacterium]
MEKLIAENDCRACMHRWENFKTLTDEQKQLISEHRYEANFKPGEIIFKKGSPTSSVIFLVSGMAKVFLEGLDGKNIIISIAKPGMMISGPGTYGDLRHHFTLTALTNVKACFIDMLVMKQLVHLNSSYAEGLISDISKKSLLMYYKLIGLTQKKMPGRLADAILYLANQIYESDEFDIILNRQELGEFTNMAKESVIRILKDFEDDGLITSNCSRIKILDKPKLQRVSENG